MDYHTNYNNWHLTTYLTKIWKNALSRVHEYKNIVTKNVLAWTRLQIFDIKRSFMCSYRGCWQRLVPNQLEYQDVWHLWGFVSRFPAENSKAIISKTVIDPSTSFWLGPVSENPFTRLDRTSWNQQRCEVWKRLVENYRRHSDIVSSSWPHHTNVCITNDFV